MRILKLIPTAFGRFHATKPLDLDPGINVVAGGNETGKSTLQAFILGMLYGFKKEGLSRVKRTDEFEKYRPWHGNDYAGVIVYEHEGRRYRVERSFDPDSTAIFDDVTGEDITVTFAQDTRREYDFARRHLGLSAREFMNTVWIGQLASRQEEGLGKEIQGKMLNLTGGGTGDLSVAEVLSLLEEERKKIGTPRTTGAVLNRMSRRILELEAEREAAKARESEVRELLKEASLLAERKAEMERAVEAALRRVREMRYVLLRKRLEQFSKISAEIADLRAQEKNLRWAAGTDERAGEMLAVLEARLAESQKNKVSVESSLARLEEERSQLLSQLDSLKRVKELGVAEADVASAYTTYLNAKSSRSQAERKLLARKQEEARVREEAKLRGIDIAQEITRDAVERGESFQEEIELLEGRERAALSELERARAQLETVNPFAGALWFYLLGIGAAVLAVAGTLLAQPWAWGAFGIALVSFAIGLVRQAAGTRGRASQVALIREKERYAAELRQNISTVRESLNAFLSSLGVSSINELRRKWHDQSEFREKFKAAADGVNEALRELEETSNALTEAENVVARLLGAAGCLLPGEPVTEEAVSALRKQIRDLNAAEQAVRTLDVRIRDNITKLAGIHEEISRISADRTQILVSQGADTAEDLDARIRSSRAHKEILKEIESRERALTSLLAGRAPEDLKEEMALLLEQIGTAPASSGYGTVTDLDLERAREELGQLERELAGIREKLARLEELVEVRNREGRPLSEVVEELSELCKRRDALQEDADALLLAFQIVQRVSAEIHREFAPDLSRRAGKVLAGITGGRYGEVKLTPDLEISLVVPETQKSVKVDNLSAGAIDQAYFALRIALAEILSGHEDFPLFLDDSFVQYDDERLRGALGILGTLRESHQVLLFTCHTREEAVLRSLGIPHRAVYIGQTDW